MQTPYGCEKTYDCCSSKCEKAYSDNCRNRNAVITQCNKTTMNCTYFADCKSKIQSWSCKSGYKQSGNGCVVEKSSCEDYGYRASDSGFYCTTKYVSELGRSCYDCVSCRSVGYQESPTPQQSCKRVSGCYDCKSGEDTHNCPGSTVWNKTQRCCVPSNCRPSGGLSCPCL